MKKLLRKDLTPSQFRRANIVVSMTISVVFLFFIIVTLTSKAVTTPVKIGSCVAMALIYIATAIFVQKNVTKRNSMLVMAFAFLISYTILVFVNSPAAMLMIFPVLMTLMVYLNEVLILWGNGAVLVLILIKSTVIRFSETGTADDFTIINIVLIGLVISAIGGSRALKRLIQFSQEETDAVKEKAAHQLEVSREVEEIVTGVTTDFNDVVENLNVIRGSIINTNIAMDQIATGSESSAEAAQRQAAMTGEIQERLENTSATANDAKMTTNELWEIIESGKKEADELEHQSNVVDESTAQISKTIEELVSNVSRVSEITDSILNISSQTNLLALNASIEAARAGEAGKGFAVVADEIRKLAEETKQSTEMITDIMNKLIHVTEATQTELQHSVESINIQRQNVKVVHESFSTVQESMSKLVGGMDVMNQEVGAVLDANKVIVDGISTLSGVSQEISANSSASKEDMELLSESIEKFSGTIDATFERLQQLKETASVDQLAE